MTYVLDSSALLRFLEGDAGVDRVKQALAGARDGACWAVISAVNWGEVIGVVAKRQGKAAADRLHTDLAPYNLEIVPVTGDHAYRAAYIKLHLGIPYADAFCVELASAPDHVLVTAGFDFKPAAHAIQIEFLPAKSKP